MVVKISQIMKEATQYKLSQMQPKAYNHVKCNSLKAIMLKLILAA